jgi:hypothetical protein
MNSASLPLCSPLLAWIVFALSALAVLPSCARACDNSSDSSQSSPAAAASDVKPNSAGVPARTVQLDGAKTTKEILSTLSKDCLPCAEKNGCLDLAQQGGNCELATGTSKISNKSESELCLDGLRCVFTSKCSNHGEETPCLCGKTDVIECMEGRSPPTGVCVDVYKKDFGNEGKAMYDQFINTAYGVGHANRIIQCVIPLCPSCRIP